MWNWLLFVELASKYILRKIIKKLIFPSFFANSRVLNKKITTSSLRLHSKLLDYCTFKVLFLKHIVEFIEKNKIRKLIWNKLLDYFAICNVNKSFHRDYADFSRTKMLNPQTKGVYYFYTENITWSTQFIHLMRTKLAQYHHHHWLIPSKIISRF